MDEIRLMKAIELNSGLDEIPEDLVRDIFLTCGYDKKDLETFCVTGYIKYENCYYKLTSKAHKVLNIKNEHKFLMKNGLFVKSKNEKGKHKCISFSEDNVLNIPIGESEYITESIEHTDLKTVFVSDCPDECSIASNKSKQVIHINE